MRNMFIPKPCPVCGNKKIHTVFVGGGHGGFLPCLCRMQCAKCGHQSKKKLFRSRSILEWNGIRNLEKAILLIVSVALLLTFTVQNSV